MKSMHYLYECVNWVVESATAAKRDIQRITSHIYDVLRKSFPHHIFTDFEGECQTSNPNVIMTDIYMTNIQAILYEHFSFRFKTFDDYVREVESANITLAELSTLVNVHNIATLIKW